jgi:hypothetical protein
MLDQLKAVFTASAWWSYVACIGGLHPGLACPSPGVAGRLVRLIGFIPRAHWPRLERQATLQSLIAGRTGAASCYCRD